ncbi:MAG TPA: type I-U CRISPR-associated helicase/endonuclease Cas3 [Thiohalobacter sp.]|nr:type I-U CRISPR-associated helicase/endonuclease Cas3 [Thiohalobacter sp.]
MSVLRFDDLFRGLWGVESFPWQRLLAEQLAEGEWPEVLDLPTAAGKTACIDIAIWALAAQAERPVWERSAPRRIWFVVDRRIVVDEAFERARKIAEKLADAQDGPLKEIADRLRKVSGTERPLAVARLRGGVLHDDGWARLPSQPAVITSTVDQLGSRLLFRGYGRSARTAPIFAGLAAHDSLILLDEAHLSVPFMQTLRAVHRFRGEAWAEAPIRTPFAFAMLSATPPADVAGDKVFPGRRREAALDHPVLHKRIHASKPATLIEVKTKRSVPGDSLALEAIARARDFVGKQGMQRTAVVVNRVAAAQHIAESLSVEFGDQADVVLLTGRLRPLERDALVARWQSLLRAGALEIPERPVVLVATQCIEVGADFSFDALVTEAASLDALRQRFGRLNRLGEAESAPAAVLIRSDDAKAGASDPIYGTAMAECWKLLVSLAEVHGEGTRQSRVVDFGIDALDGRLAGVEDWSSCIAPTENAPLLLPAHLDLLAQTSPLPHVQPDVSLYLHGAGRGEPEVRVVWRADLKEGQPDEVWKETVALCPPSTLETLSVPLFRLRRWLQRPDSADEDGDVEGAAGGTGERATGGAPRPVLAWRGRDRSTVVRHGSQFKPNDLVVLPAAYGIAGLGQASPDQVLGSDGLDIWEPAHARSGKAPGLRLQRDVLKQWLDCQPLKELVVLAETADWDGDTLRTAIDAVLEYASDSANAPLAPPRWWLERLRVVRDGKTEQHPAGGLVLFAKPAEGAYQEQDLFADDDDLLSAAGREVPLEVHSALVERATAQLAERCLPEAFHEPLRSAAYWHDVGKLDERFQIWLRQGDELAAIGGAPLAKSKEMVISPARRRWLRKASRLPEQFRHEMLSLQLAEGYMPLCTDAAMHELALHCVSGHHGYGRPFAPVTDDPQPPAVEGGHDGIDIRMGSAARTGRPAPHSPASGIAERFWCLNRRYGWWGLAYLEAIMRLGDWYGSRLTAEELPSRAARPQPAPRKSVAQEATDPLLLTGIDGANPLGFLAALGTLVVLHQAGCTDARLAWRRGVTWQPTLTGLSMDYSTELAGVLAQALEGGTVTETAEAERAQAEKRLADIKKSIKDKKQEIKQRGLRGKDKKEVEQTELAPLKQARDKAHQALLKALRDAVPSPELALGANIDIDAEGFLAVTEPLLNGADQKTRRPLDMLAAFTSDVCLHSSPTKSKEGKLAPAPFAFITGGGHQDFLGTARQLMGRITPEKIAETLFEPWKYADEGLSMRWDPVEDRRYALLDRDPTASDNKPRTVWMANLLAYRALALFPSAPRGKRLATTGWSRHNKEEVFTWPLWTCPLSPDTIRSLLLLPELHDEHPDRAALRAREIGAVLRARRIRVGEGANFKINFSPAREV